MKIKILGDSEVDRIEGNKPRLYMEPESREDFELLHKLADDYKVGFGQDVDGNTEHVSVYLEERNHEHIETTEAIPVPEFVPKGRWIWMLDSRGWWYSSEIKPHRTDEGWNEPETAIHILESEAPELYQWQGPIESACVQVGEGPEDESETLKDIEIERLKSWLTKIKNEAWKETPVEILEAMAQDSTIYSNCAIHTKLPRDWEEQGKWPPEKVNEEYAEIYEAIKAKQPCADELWNRRHDGNEN